MEAPLKILCALTSLALLACNCPLFASTTEPGLVGLQIIDSAFGLSYAHDINDALAISLRRASLIFAIVNMLLIVARAPSLEKDTRYSLFAACVFSFIAWRTQNLGGYSHLTSVLTTVLGLISSGFPLIALLFQPTRPISPVFASLLAVGALSWGAYGWHLQAGPIVLPNLVTLALAVAQLGLWYSRREKAAAPLGSGKAGGGGARGKKAARGGHVGGRAVVGD
jgi:hypothetical protein